MCGIAGICNLNNETIDKQLLLAMAEKISHRGPDDSGIFLHENFGLCHARLSIIDLSSAGHQPMGDSDGVLQIVFNGEIYNFQEIRKNLENLGYNFKSKTDTEVILYSYKEWGKDCVKKFNGMFAFAILDKRNGSIFLARDRMGEKPLYYCLDNNKFIFASEIKAILEDKSIPRVVDKQGLVNYFTFGHSIAPDTIYSGIKKVLPGSYIIFKNGKIISEKYWDLPFSVEADDKGEEYYIQKTKNILENSVKERLISDVPLGVFLSGGVDSSLMVAMMAKNKVSPIRTFSVGFNTGGKEFNELSDAKIVADYFKTEHHEIILGESDLKSTLDKLVYHFDEPFGDAASFPVFFMSEFAKKYVSVVLTGEGGDEIFGGYRRYLMEKNKSKFLTLNSILNNNISKTFFNALPNFRRVKKAVSAFSIKDDLKRYVSWMSFFSPEALDSLFIDKNLPDPLEIYKQYFSLYKDSDWLKTIMKLDQKILLPDGYLEKVDKTTMAFGLESRAPFLDHNIVEFADSIPSKYKINGRTTKYILRKVLSEFLPESICNKAKHGFAVPTNIWLKGKLKDYLFEIIFDDKTKQRGYFNYDYIEKIYKNYKDNSQPLDSQLWLLLNFELWHRQFIDKN